MRTPAAFLVVSAHFERAPLTIGTTRSRELMYDFSGFPPALYEVRCPAPETPELAARATALLADFRPVASDRPWDHGVWTPLVHMAPRADVPVLEVSMPHTASAAGYREHAPDVELAHPSEEHLRPILVAAGAAAEAGQVSFPTTGWEWGTISRRSVQLG